MGLIVREGNGLDKMLLNALMRRDEVSDARWVDKCIATHYYPRFCKNLRREETAEKFSLERARELFSKTSNRPYDKGGVSHIEVHPIHG